MLLLILFAPIVAAVAIMSGAPARRSAILAATIELIGVGLLVFGFDKGAVGFQFVTAWTINADWGWRFALGIDGLSLIMLLLTALVTFAAVWFTAEISRNEGAFYSCLLFISAGAIGAFASIDLFFFYAFHELALIPTFLLIGIWGSGNRQTAAWKITIYLAIGSFILLLGLILLYRSLPATSRSFDFGVLQAAAGQISVGAQQTIYLVLLIGFGILISLFPFHTWAPEAYASAPSPAAMLHAGVLKKFGLYGLLRLAIPLLPAGAQYWNKLLIVLLLGNIIYVGLVTIAQKRLDWMLGYSSVMHMGYIFLGIASANIIGIYGAAILMLAHGLSIALLFGITGELRRRTGTLVFEDLGGLAKVMPFAGFVFGLAAFAAIGLPGFANFAGEVLIFFGAFRRGANMLRFDTFQVATTLALWGVVISAVYMLRAYRAVFMGNMESKWSGLVDLRNSLRLPITLLIAALLAIGFFPQSFVQIVTPPFRSFFAAK
jgi:NADH-quinone oxidoreductase subunit M